MTETVTIHFIHAPSREKRDCFAYNGGYFAHDGGCAALKKMVCNAEGKCPFYRPQEKESEETA